MLGFKNHHSNTSDVGALAKGGSLWQDAWRKLWCNRVAMVSMWILVVICGLALLTPLLPLDPPDRDRTDLQYEPPQLIPLFRPTFSLDIKAIQKSSEVAPAHGDSQTFEQRQQVRDVAQNPYRIAGFPDLGPLSRWMVRTRYWLFGHWSLGPVAGRDLLGRDVFSRLFWGARVSLIVGLVATLVSLLIGVTWGAVAGYCGGFVDDLMMRIVDILYSIPFIFVVIFIITILGQRDIKMTLELVGIDRITIFFLVVGAIYWLTMARVVRGQVISLKHEPFIEAARALGVSQPSIIARHILPNLVSIVIVYLTLTIPRVMLFEAFLSFLGLGVEPPNVSWGLLANEGIKVINPVKIYWWLIVFPSAALGITLFSLNFLGDGLRDALDPKIETK